MRSTDALAMLVLKPDSVHQGLARGILAFLIERGFRILRSEWKRMTPELRFRLYRPDVNRWSTNWELGGQLYGMGPVHVILLRNDRVPPPFVSASDYLARGLKGCHDPLGAPAGTIRGDFNAVNRALNLVHTADDTEAVARELQILVDWKDLGELGNGATAPEPAAELRPRLLDFPSLVTWVYARLLVDDCPDAGFRRAAWTLIDRTRRRTAAVSDRRARHQVILSVLPAVHELAVCRPDERGWLAATLSHRDRLIEMDYPAVFARMTAAGLALDRWSQYVLHTSLYYLDPDETRRLEHVRNGLPRE